MIKYEYKKIFVPGGNGFLGQRTCKELDDKGLAFISKSYRDGIDFRNLDQLLALFEKEKFDAVINCSAFVGGIKFGYERPAEIYFNNILMATNLMEASRLTGVKKFINPISNCSYPGHLTRDFREDQWWNGPLDNSVLVYGFVRKASWVQSLAYYMQYGLNTINLILPNMYGPGDHFDETRSHALGALVMKFIEARKKQMPEVIVWGTGTPIREWLYVDDGAEMMVRALNIEAGIEPVNVGVGKGISIHDLAYLIRDIVGYEGLITFDTSRPDGAPHKTMDNSKLLNIANWMPPTGLREGISETVLWYMDNYK